MWQSGIEASRRIDELKSGIPIGETLVIKGPEEAWTKVTKVLEAAKKDIVIITTSQSINKLAENDPLVAYFKKGLNVKIMASIDLDNLEPAQKLATLYEVKHVPISYMTMMLVDNKHLFMFKMPPLSDFGTESALYLADTFYSSDSSQIERVSEMLSDIWKRGIDITEISSQAGTKLPTIEASTTETVAKVVDIMLQNGVNSILITEHHKPVGVINDRELLKEIVNKEKDPKKTLAKDLNYMPLVILEADESMISAMNLIQKRGIKRAAMVKNGQLIGMLTEEMVKRAPYQG
jgi:signal-transduction protein with cAMP-binding, CBS, and nucleotidyltransferase domain